MIVHWQSSKQGKQMKYPLCVNLTFLFSICALAAEPTEVHHLARTDGTQITYYITRPTGVQGYPFLIVMQGSECTTGYIQAKDSSFVDALKVASVVVEKYGVTKDTIDCPQSYLENNTIDQRIRDYLLVMDFLRAIEKSWDKNVVLAGGSEGGEVASLVAPLIPETSRLIVMAAGGGMTMADDLLLLLSKQMTTQGATKDQIQKAQNDYKLKYVEIKSNPTSKLN
jgi:dienelactone hydrolase